MNQSVLVERISGKSGSSRERFGGKANSLNELVDAGVPVPKAYVVTIDAYKHFIQHNNISKENAKRTHNGNLRKMIETSEMPIGIQQEILKAYNDVGKNKDVAVRSSAINEDSESQSFAGQYDTYLHIKGEANVIEKVKFCWGSLWSDGVVSYQGDTSNEEEEAIGVVIQEMIDADCAGILFTRDPMTGDANQFVIDGCWGLGEGVVSGQVVTDSFKVDVTSNKVIEENIGEKDHYSGLDQNRELTLLATPKERVNEVCLTTDQILLLVEHAKKIRQHFGTDVDIEWAYKDNNIWILQARAITVVHQKSEELIYADPDETDQNKKDNAFFSRMDTGEIVTGLMTPLGLSFCRFYQKHVHGPAIKTMGLSDIMKPHEFMGYIQGHVYLNISASAHMLRQCPPTRDEMVFTTRYATPNIDFSNYANPYGKGVEGFEYFKSACYWLKAQVANNFKAKGIVKDMIALRRTETKRFVALDLSSMTIEELNEELTRIDRNFLDSCAAYMPFFLQSFALYDALTENCDKWLKDKGNGLQNRIKSSMNNLRTIEVTKGIISLVDKVNSLPELKKIFNQHTAEELLELLPEHPHGKAFWDKDFGEFLLDFGSRGRQEFELSIPRWYDDPSYLLNVMKMYLEHGVDLDKKLEVTEEARLNDTECLLKGIPWKGRKIIKFIIKLYGVMAERREATRPTFITETWFYRRIIKEVVKRLDAQKIISESDFKYIDFNLFRAYMAGEIHAEDAFSEEVINKNRHYHLLNLHAEEPPMAIIGGHKPMSSMDTVSNASDSLVGLGVSPGVVVAKARVITDLQKQVKDFQPGEILVTKFTDASWTPLFVLAKGIVADIGSALSHSSIVSREFGIPAVVNVKTGTKVIKTGDTIYIDGDAGVVKIEEALA